MERIKTASRIIDLFAPPAAVGRDGFGDLPPDQTQLDASFFNNVQETLGQAIEGQGIPLDGLNFNQLTEAINIWSTFTSMGGDTATFMQVFIQGMAALKIGLNVTGAGDITASSIDGNGHTAVTAVTTSAQPTAIMVNLGTGRATFVQCDDAASCAQRVENIGGGCAQQITGVGSATTLEVENTGTGQGAAITNDDPTSATLAVVNNNGAGPGLTVDGSVTLGTSITTPVETKGLLTMSEGGALVAGKTFTANGTVDILGAGGGSLNGDSATIMNWPGTATLNGRIRVLATILSTVGDFGKDGAGNMLWHDGGAAKIAHISPSGWFRGHNQVDFVAAAASITLDTTAAVAPKAVADVDIFADLSIQRAIAGDVTISIDEVGGAGQIGTSRIYAAPVTGTSTFLNVTFSRTRAAADITPRVYRVTVDGGGSDVNLGGGRIVAEPATGS